MRILRASIEEDYSKRLAKLARMALGRDEIGYVHIPPAQWHACHVHKHALWCELPSQFLNFIKKMLSQI
jgi:hypothetical protein